MKNTRVLIRAKGRGLCIERGLFDCLERELFADISLSCDGSRVRANRGVLAAASPVMANLLKDWPITEDACIIMAGYTEEEVQGLVRYIYTGQLSSESTGPQCGVWEKIIEDFRVGLIQTDFDPMLELDDPLAKVEENGPASAMAMAMAGPNFVSVTTPRPLIVQVQSLTSRQHSSPLTDHNNSDIPLEMSIDESNAELNEESEEDEFAASLEQQQTNAMAITNGSKRKRPSKTAVISAKKVRPKAGQPASNEATESSSATVSAALKKLAGKRAKPFTKFTRKKYCCPFCNRRFLTRGNVKNHMRIHSREKPFQCPVCQDLFAYQGVYQRHLLRHRENNEIGEEELGPILADSLRVAAELSMNGQTLEEEPATSDLLEPHDDDEILDPDAGLDDEDEVEHIENGVDLEEAEDASETKSESKSSSTERTDGAHFLDTEEKNDSLELSDDEAATGALPTSTFLPSGQKEGTAKGKTKAGAAGKEGGKGPKHRMNYQIIECDYCPMKYHKWSAFYVHRCSHTGETPVLPCGVCDMEFPNIKALKEHKTTAHPSAVFQCDQCERSFLSRSALLMHRPVHSTKLNFQCRYCQAKMRTLKERYVHERIHTADETPYQCSQCDKQFNTLVNLRSHLKLHANEAEATPTSLGVRSTTRD